MRTTVLASLVLLLSTNFILAQSSFEEDLLAGPEWFYGSLMLNNGKEVKGLIKYNDKTDIVCLETGRETKTYTARHAKGFEFYDEVEKKQRIFYTVEVEDRVNNAKRPLFFEVVVELNDFAVLSKLAPIRVDKREYTTPAMFNPATGSFSAGRYYGYPSTISHTETLFLFSKDGEIRPYLEITEKEIDGMFYDRSVVKNRIIDDETLKNFTSPYYNDLINYAAKNELDLKRKNDFIAVMKYYNSLNRN
jgi:hypothetical protein